MVIPKNTIPEKKISDKAKQALTAMIEFQMYLLAQPNLTSWPMASRTKNALPDRKEPYSNSVESSVGTELIEWGFIEQSSRVTYVVSKSGLAFYNREIKPDAK